MISILIPARDESSVIRRALKAIVTGSSPEEELEVIVICNACADETAAIARRFGRPVRVIETEVAGKTNALNLGDQVASGFPRIYADADVVISREAVRALAARLDRGDVLAVAPLPRINLDACSYFVRAYYDIRSRLPSAREGIGGSGVYALSRAGRSRFGHFPDVTADDGFVRVHFKPNERETLVYAHSDVFAPRTIKDLIPIRVRAYFGSTELARRFPDLWKNRGERSNYKSVIRLLAKPSLWLKLAVYSYVNALARHKARSRTRASRLAWERDETSRIADPETRSAVRSRGSS